VVNALVSINEVNVRRARLVLGWATVSRVQLPVPKNLSHYITSHPGQLSLAILQWVVATSTSQTAVMPCGWGVKTGMVREWWHCVIPLLSRAIPERFSSGLSHNTSVRLLCLLRTALLQLSINFSTYLGIRVSLELLSILAASRISTKIWTTTTTTTLILGCTNS